MHKNPLILRFGGETATILLIVAGTLLLLGLVGSGSYLGIAPLIVLGLPSALVIAILRSFRLDIDPQGLTRHLGPSLLHCRWDDLRIARVTSVAGLGRIRLLVRDRRGRQISFPLFLMARPQRCSLAEAFLKHLPEALKKQWLGDGSDYQLRQP
ncbi:hypothetical protein [Gloeobacter kilaueensis]|uniref:Uncharacterized protein n=1 Tax=Gloeobacter kilaueensis (strain ATCC BAA-2537 / CCAP 1431/1 / ULC 316 / JS1) TaxID=1183438 RepID=U5QLF0_GLOK1|nr:hypothetical protein [Gloeobacter kilaueensis]AGY59761.1 hypothetical protein GKIL_3515 [Gloeobacter kilaueensis JS1]